MLNERRHQQSLLAACIKQKKKAHEHTHKSKEDKINDVLVPLAMGTPTAKISLVMDIVCCVPFVVAEYERERFSYHSCSFSRFVS